MSPTYSQMIHKKMHMNLSTGYMGALPKHYHATSSNFEISKLSYKIENTCCPK